MSSAVISDADIRRIIGPTTDPCNSHRPVLAEALIRVPEGPILELGCGFGSTPGLDEVARLTERLLVSYEHDAKWFRTFEPMAGPFHQLHKIESFEEIDATEHEWGVALVDHGFGGRRAREIGRLAQQARVVVVHDTEDTAYGYWTIFGLFKHRFDYMKEKPWTTVFSNFVDVSEWRIPE